MEKMKEVLSATMAICQTVYTAERNETVRTESFGDKEHKYSKKVYNVVLSNKIAIK